MFDAHCHLSLFDANEFHFDNLSGIASCATNVDDWEKTLSYSKLSNDSFKVCLFIGTHPWYCDKYNEELLEKLLANNLNVGVGEIGLDNVRKDEKQLEIFLSQLKLALKYNRLVVIHCVHAYSELRHCFKEVKILPNKVLLHGFSGTLSDVDYFNKYGCYYSFSDKNLKENILNSIPKNRILAETDSPNKNNVKILNVVDNIKKMTNISEAQLLNNALEFFMGIDND
ncbi:MAG: TatD family hydrolase [Alphaproteobacteria bacterium]|nr:TatD family hydrolase [Alphaproteobacteria bacterium]